MKNFFITVNGKQNPVGFTHLKNALNVALDYDPTDKIEIKNTNGVRIDISDAKNLVEEIKATKATKATNGIEGDESDQPDT